MAYCVVPNSFVYISYNPDILLLASNCIICWMAGIRNRMFVSLLPVVTTLSDDKLPRQQKINAMNGAHLASPIRGQLGYAHWPQLGTQFIALLGTKFGPH